MHSSVGIANIMAFTEFQQVMRYVASLMFDGEEFTRVAPFGTYEEAVTAYYKHAARVAAREFDSYDKFHSYRGHLLTLYNQKHECWKSETRSVKRLRPRHHKDNV